MKSLLYHQAFKPTWQNPYCFSRTSLPGSIRAWLLYPGSLTQKIRANFDGLLTIRVLQEKLAIMTNSEARRFHNTPSYALVRESQILMNSNVLIYARSIMPMTAQGIYQQQLKKLGTRPLGDLLFTHAHVKRQEFELAKIGSNCKAYNFVTNADQQPLFVWARRSIIRLPKVAEILLTEVFSEEFIEKIRALKI